MVTTFNRKDLVSFGNFLLSPEREARFRLHPESDKLPPLEDRLSQVHHVDIENWLESRNKKKRQFIKGDLIIHKSDVWKCIMSDDEHALFARVRFNHEFTQVSFTKTFVVSNDESVNSGVFEFERTCREDWLEEWPEE